MITTIILIIVGLLILFALWHIIKSITQLAINSILGILLLFMANFLHIFSIVGKPDMPITWISLIVCALAGIPGAILLMVLYIVGLI